MSIATQLGYRCIFLGPATPIQTIIGEIEKTNPEIVGLSYRLTPSTVHPLLESFKNTYEKLKIKPIRLFFAGTPEVVEQAKQHELFNGYFIGGESRYKVLTILKGEIHDRPDDRKIPMDLISRIEWKKPYPVLRAHFGLSNLEDTLRGIQEIAREEVLDIISIAPDQNTQSNYFHPDQQVRELSGAGGVPLRSREDFEKLHQARLTGNHPLLRIYAGTRDFIKLAQLYRETIQNSWAAIPIFWFNQMDGRGPLTLKESIKQHLETIKWHADMDIPVEINDPHHWSLRDAPDSITVADAYLCGIIAKKLGVKHYIAQYMFNTPPSSSFDMDLAKILAMDELIQTLTDESFSVLKQVRTGLTSFPLDLNKAKGQLAAATMVQLTIKPDIIHVVNFSEANHAARPEEIIESCNIVDQIIDRIYSSTLNIVDKKIKARKEELIAQAREIVDLIPKLAKYPSEKRNPYTNYEVLNRIVEYGIFDAPHLNGNKYALGEIKTKLINGACYTWDDSKSKVINEVERMKNIFMKNPLNGFSNPLFKKKFGIKEGINE